MASAKITQLPALTTPDNGDLLVIVDDPSGSPVTKKITAANLLTLQTVRVATVMLTNAQILALPTTPVTLLAAAAAGYRNKLIGATLMVNMAGGAYTNVDTDYAAIQVVESTGAFLTGSVLNATGLVGGAALTLTTELLASTPGQRLFDFPLAALAARLYAASSYAEIQGGLAGIGTPSLQLSMDNNSAGVLTGGNAANYARVTVYYAVEATL